MQFVMVVTIEDETLDGDDSIENAARIVNGLLDTPVVEARPLSEVISA